MTNVLPLPLSPSSEVRAYEKNAKAASRDGTALKAPFQAIGTGVSKPLPSLSNSPKHAPVYRSLRQPDDSRCSSHKHRAQKKNYLRNELGLTPAETMIGIALLDGKCSQEIAADRRVSINTLRKQVNTVLSKTDCRTQHQFVAETLTAIYSRRSLGRPQLES